MLRHLHSTVIALLLCTLSVVHTALAGTNLLKIDLITAPTPTSSPAIQLLIPDGSYLTRDIFGGNQGCDPGSVSYNPESGSITAACSVVQGVPLTLKNGYECWANGHDIKIGSTPRANSIARDTALVCDTSVTRTPVNLAEFLMENWVPNGSYLRTCMGQIYDKNRQKLWSTCQRNFSDRRKRRLITWMMYFYRSSTINLSPNSGWHSGSLGVTNLNATLHLAPEKFDTNRFVPPVPLSWANDNLDQCFINTYNDMASSRPGSIRFSCLPRVSGCAYRFFDLRQFSSSRDLIAHNEVPPGRYLSRCLGKVYDYDADLLHAACSRDDANYWRDITTLAENQLGCSINRFNARLVPTILLGARQCIKNGGHITTQHGELICDMTPVIVVAAPSQTLPQLNPIDEPPSNGALELRSYSVHAFLIPFLILIL